MKILLVGSGGQLGTAIQKTCPEWAELTLCDYPGFNIADSDSVESFMAGRNDDWVINAAAYTAVDLAESEPEKAARINFDGVRVLAKAVKKNNGRLVHISTDFVFDGEKGRPYQPDDPVSPLSVYGKTKADGEAAVQSVFRENSLIIRTAWLYSETGGNFVKTMIRLMTEKEAISVVTDQIGTPCYADGLAEAVWMAIRNNSRGVHHWTDAGVASWYDFAVAIQEEALRLGILGREIPISPIPSVDYPTPAKRPFYSVLDKSSAIKAFGIEPKHWRLRLREMLGQLSS